MRLSLIPHPDTPCPAVSTIGVDLVREGSVLRLVYELTGKLSDLLIPPPQLPVRSHRLWEHSCFEAFIRPAGGEAYWEFNFAPSGEWAAYRLGSYRRDMIQAAEPSTPVTETVETGDKLELRAQVETGLAHDLAWSVGLSAVVADGAGKRSFWALAHPEGEPDFHSPDCFALELAPPFAA